MRIKSLFRLTWKRFCAQNPCSSSLQCYFTPQIVVQACFKVTLRSRLIFKPAPSLHSTYFFKATVQRSCALSRCALLHFTLLYKTRAWICTGSHQYICIHYFFTSACNQRTAGSSPMYGQLSCATTALMEWGRYVTGRRGVRPGCYAPGKLPAPTGPREQPPLAGQEAGATEDHPLKPSN